MKEIRLVWTLEGQENIKGTKIQTGPWKPLTKEKKRKMTVLMEEGNKIFGRGTHWIEEREA